MNDAYKEIMVKRSTPFYYKILKGFMIIMTVLCMILGLGGLWPLLIAGVALIAACVFVIPKFDVEFEYLYVNGELDVDAIYSKQKRKKKGSYDVSELEILAPENSHELDSFKNKKDLKLNDYTSLDPNAKSYIMVVNKEKGQEMIKVELDDYILNDLRRMAPRKVHQY